METISPGISAQGRQCLLFDKAEMRFGEGLTILFYRVIIRIVVLIKQHTRLAMVRSMLVRDRIFSKLEELDMTQKEFSEKTGIPQSTISDWRKKRTNPTAEKIMVICKVLDVTPQWLLSGTEPQGNRGNPREWFAIDAETDVGRLVTSYNSMDSGLQERLLGYVEALNRMMEEKKAKDSSK